MINSKSNSAKKSLQHNVFSCEINVNCVWSKIVYTFKITTAATTTMTESSFGVELIYKIILESHTHNCKIIQGSGEYISRQKAEGHDSYVFWCLDNYNGSCRVACCIKSRKISFESSSTVSNFLDLSM